MQLRIAALALIFAVAAADQGVRGAAAAELPTDEQTRGKTDLQTAVSPEIVDVPKVVEFGETEKVNPYPAAS
ncbi:unnamed protein product, partial [Prorocentrum cordatum]